MTQSVRHRCQTPIKVSDTVYDFALLSEGTDYIYNISFRTHPLLLGREGFIDHYRLSAADIDYAQILVNGEPVSTIYNSVRNEPVCFQNQMSGIFSVENMPFFNGDPIVTGLLVRDPVLRVVFWREPVAPFWITFTLANCECAHAHAHAQGHVHCCGGWGYQVQSYDGHKYMYQWGTMTRI